ncbi:hypothetical protein POM88_024390 [Heracleum sosnowskyi]|uniref:Uncharacterized protein n=1 Tax=Heracleum sosnowskyi TaxID=360622 RepID=A0AAD8I2A7_9APIA|nr:hypothetical protein POM88_024390 [Heracleum sosnowskyi]
MVLLMNNKLQVNYILMPDISIIFESQQVPMELFTPIVSYDPILNMEYLDPSYNCVEFTAQKDISERIKSSYANVPPFSGMNIPASGVVLQNCSEQGARMSAMDNSSKNAGNMFDHLILAYNR